jgi:TolB-like protein/Flp pilus assembly protein TadD
LSFINELRRRNVFKVGAAYIVVSWLIIQVVDVAINNIGAPDWVFQVILLVLGIGLPVILLFAWAFEMTPEGLKREREVDRSQSITPQTGRKLNSMIIGILVLTLGYFVLDKFVLSPEGTTGAIEPSVNTAANSESETPVVVERSIAVLPLANRSAREEDQYFADGMHDDLLTQLAKIASLRVISRTSVMRYRDTELSIPEIAQQLGVNAILEGGVQRSGDQIRINMQLIEAETDEHLWAETYDRQMTTENLFAIQSEITRQITDAMKATLTPEEAARIDERATDSLEAFQEYMKGQQLLALRTVPSLEAGKAHFERAIELDPGFAQAVTGLANAYHLLYEYADWPEAESLEPAMELLNQALELSPDLGEAYMVRGEIYRHRDDLEAAQLDFERAIELIPGNAAVYHWFSFVRAQQNDKEGAFVLLRRAHQLDPMSRVIHINYAMQPFFNGQDEDALVELERVRLLHPEYPAVYTYQSWVYWAHGDPVGALRTGRKAFELDPQNNRSGRYCYSYLDLDAAESALDCLTKDQSLEATEKILLRIILHLVNGNPDMAKAVLDSAWDMEGDVEDKAFAALALGDFEMARPGYEEEYPDWFEGPVPAELTAGDIDNAVDVALVLQKTGEGERAASLLNVAIETMKTLKRNRGADAYGFLDVGAYAMLGQTEQALTALEECAELEYLSNWQGLKFLPHYDAIRGDPRFSAALSRLNAATELARKRAISEGLL